MKSIINTVITGSAVIGTFLIIGAAGNSDCIADYPISSTIKMVVIGMILIVPAVIRGVLHE